MKMRYWYRHFPGDLATGAARCPPHPVTTGGDSPDGPYNKYLASALHSDMPAPEYCEEIIQAIAKLKRGEMEKWNWVGNAFFTDIYPDRVEIEHQHFPDDPYWEKWRFSLDEFEVALVGWKRFLEMPVSLESEVIVELPSSDHS